jgi:Tfp pilus assembly protein PilO
MTLSKQKQTALLRLGAITAVVLFALWYFLVRSAQASLSQKTNAINNLTQKIESKKRVIETDGQTKAQVKESARKLQEIEDQMVTGDVYLWIEKTLRDFEIKDQIEFTKYDPPQTIDSDLPLKLPYKIVSFAVSGSAAYHDLGTFLANFENSYPHIRIRRLEMEPASFGSSKNEKLTFLMEMQVLVKPGTSRSKPRS